MLRDWAVGFLLDENGELLNALSKDQALSPGLARGLEIAARLALESDATGARWPILLAMVERDGVHGSWKRPVLLALPRSEQALALFQGLKAILLEADGRRLSEIIRLMIAVELRTDHEDHRTCSAIHRRSVRRGRFDRPEGPRLDMAGYGLKRMRNCPQRLSPTSRRFSRRG